MFSDHELRLRCRLMCLPAIAILASTRRVIETLAPGHKVGSFFLTDDHAGPSERVLIEGISRSCSM